MEEKLDSHLFRQTTSETTLKEHDGRLRILEQGSAKIIGIASFIAIGVTSFGSYLLGAFKL